MRISDPKQLDQLLHPMIDPKIKLKALAKGLPASPGAAVGQVCRQAPAAHEQNLPEIPAKGGQSLNVFEDFSCKLPILHPWVQSKFYAAIFQHTDDRMNNEEVRC